QAVLGLLAAPAQQDGAEADREALDAHAGEPRDEEMAELVHENQDADDDDEPHHHDENVDCHCHDLPPERAAIQSRTRRRVRASTSTHSSMDPSSAGGSAASARSRDSVISGNPMRRSRKAATASYLAALSDPGPPPPSG